MSYAKPAERCGDASGRAAGVARLPVLGIRSGAGRQVPHHGLGAAVLPQLAEKSDEITLGVQGVGMVLTQRPPVPQKGVLQDVKGSLMIAEAPQETRETGCRAQCAGIVGTECEAAPTQHVLAPLPGLFVSTERGEAPAKVAGDGQGQGVLPAQRPLAAREKVRERIPRLSIFPEADQAPGEPVGHRQCVRMVLPERFAPGCVGYAGEGHAGFVLAGHVQIAQHLYEQGPEFL